MVALLSHLFPSSVSVGSVHSHTSEHEDKDNKPKSAEAFSLLLSLSEIGHHLDLLNNGL